jgi:ribose transport system substrate-binding protein
VTFFLQRVFVVKALRQIVFIFPFFGLVACGESSIQSVSTVSKVDASITQAVPAPAKKKIGFVMKTLTNPFFIEMEKGARRAEQALNIELVVKTAAQETSIEQQIQIVEDLIAAKVDAIVIAPGDSELLVPVLKKAEDAGIKLVNIDNRLDAEAIKKAGVQAIPFISVENDKAAYNSAKYISEDAIPGTQAAILEGIRTADNARQRMEGAKRAFTESKDIKLVASESANWKIDEAYRVSKQLFDKHPDIKLMFAANDMMALGALKFLQESKRTQVKVAAYDALEEAVAEVKAGRLAVTVDQQAAEQGFQGVMLATRLLKGESVPALMLIDTRLITAATFK